MIYDIYIYIYIVLVTCCVQAACGWTGFASRGVCAKVVRERSRKRSERKEVFFRRVYTYNNILRLPLSCLRRCRGGLKRQTETKRRSPLHLSRRMGSACSRTQLSRPRAVE
jgi:hypothetical protein